MADRHRVIVVPPGPNVNPPANGRKRGNYHPHLFAIITATMCWAKHNAWLNWRDMQGRKCRQQDDDDSSTYYYNTDDMQGIRFQGPPIGLTVA